MSASIMEVPCRRVGGVRSGCSVEMWCCCVHKCQEHYPLYSHERRTYSLCSLQCSSQEASMICMSGKLLGMLS